MRAAVADVPGGLTIAGVVGKHRAFDVDFIENQQCERQTQIYSSMMSGLMDARGAIINNNMNLVMKRLTSITIMISLPTLVASFFGMNVLVPFQDQLRGFWIALGISALVAGVVAWYFNKKRWF